MHSLIGVGLGRQVHHPAKRFAKLFCFRLISATNAVRGFDHGGSDRLRTRNEPVGGMAGRSQAEIGLGAVEVMVCVPCLLIDVENKQAASVLNREETVFYARTSHA